jgi:hypothetical protein
MELHLLNIKTADDQFLDVLLFADQESVKQAMKENLVKQILGDLPESAYPLSAKSHILSEAEIEGIWNIESRPVMKYDPADGKWRLGQVKESE